MAVASAEVDQDGLKKDGVNMEDPQMWDNSNGYKVADSPK